MPRVLAGPIDVMSLRVREFVVAIPKPGGEDRTAFRKRDHDFVIEAFRRNKLKDRSN